MCRRTCEFGGPPAVCLGNDIRWQSENNGCQVCAKTGNNLLLVCIWFVRRDFTLLIVIIQKTINLNSPQDFSQIWIKKTGFTTITHTCETNIPDENFCSCELVHLMLFNCFGSQSFCCHGTCPRGGGGTGSQWIGPRPFHCKQRRGQPSCRLGIRLGVKAPKLLTTDSKISFIMYICACWCESKNITSHSWQVTTEFVPLI